MFLWPLTRRKLRCALIIPAAHQRLIIVPSRQHLTLRAVLRLIEMIDSIAFVHVSVRVSGWKVACTPNSHHVPTMIVSRGRRWIERSESGSIRQPMP